MQRSAQSAQSHSLKHPRVPHSSSMIPRAAFRATLRHAPSGREFPFRLRKREIRFVPIASSERINCAVLGLYIVDANSERGEISSLTKNVSDGAEVSLRRPPRSQERTRKKKNRPVSFEMTVVWGALRRASLPISRNAERCRKSGVRSRPCGRADLESGHEVCRGRGSEARKAAKRQDS